MRVLILHDDVATDARADELDVLEQLTAVAACLEAAGHDVTRQSVGLDLAAAASGVRECAPDVVFNLVETIDRTGRLVHVLPALLDHLRVPYTGNGTAALFLSSGKLNAKRVLRAAGIDTPAYWTAADLAAGARPTGRVVVKSDWEHGSVGLDDRSVMAGAEPREVLARLDAVAPDLGGSAFAETYIHGREFNIALLQVDGAPRVLPPAEMLFVDWPDERPRILGFDAKWTEGEAVGGDTCRSFDHPPSDAALLRRVTETSRRVWDAFGLRGCARVDLRIDDEGTTWVVDVNANPCLTPGVGFCSALEQAGLTLTDAVAYLLDAALADRRT